MVQFKPVISFTAKSIVCYDEYLHRGGKTRKNPFNDVNQKGRQLNGFMSTATRESLRKKLSSYYDAMYIAGQSYRNQMKIFHPIVTLTLPSVQAHDDNQIKRECLTRFIERIRYNYDVRFYYWVAEKQMNGNIHFHLLIDRYIDYQEVREQWNNRLQSLGYLDAFESKHGHRNPNSTDIQAIRNLSRSSDYVTKYTSKVDQSGGILGRLHGECDLLRECVRYKEVNWSELNDMLFHLARRKVLKYKRLDHCVIFEGDIRRIMAGHMPYTLQRWNDSCLDLCSKFYG